MKEEDIRDLFTTTANVNGKVLSASGNTYGGDVGRTIYKDENTDLKTDTIPHYLTTNIGKGIYVWYVNKWLGKVIIDYQNDSVEEIAEKVNKENINEWLSMIAFEERGLKELIEELESKDIEIDKLKIGINF